MLKVNGKNGVLRKEKFEKQLKKVEGEVKR